VFDGRGVHDMRESLIERHASPETKDKYTDNKSPKVQLASVAERMFVIGWLSTVANAEQHQRAIACIDHRVDCL
jgi:hypothetical protein